MTSGRACALALVALVLAPCMGSVVFSQSAVPAEGRLVHERALALLGEGRRADARRYLEAVGASATLEYGPVAALLGTLRRDDGELDGAIRAFETGLAAPGGEADATLWTELAVSRSWQGDLAGAEAAYRRALRAQPSFRPATVGLARILRWKGDSQEASELYQRLLSDGLDPVEAFVGMGFLALEALDVDEARGWFQRALSLAPENAEARDGFGRIDEARRWQLKWNVTRAGGGRAGDGGQWMASASYRVTPAGTVTGTLEGSPLVRDIVGGDLLASPQSRLAWSATLGWAQRITRNWNGALSLKRLSLDAGDGTLLTAESGRWLSSKWNANAGVRGGHLPSIGSEMVAWAGLTRIGAHRRAASVTMFYGTDFREASSRSVLLSTSSGVGSRVTLRGTYARGWTRATGFWQTTVESRLRLSGRHELTAEFFRFVGAYRSTGLRAGARVGL